MLSLLRLSDQVVINPAGISAIRWEDFDGRLLIYHPTAPGGYYAVAQPLAAEILQSLMGPRAGGVRLNEDTWVNPMDITAVRWEPRGLGEARLLVYHPTAPAGYYVVDPPREPSVAAFFGISAPAQKPSD